MGNPKLASCPWGPVTAHGLGLLTEMYVIVTDARTEGWKARKCIRIVYNKLLDYSFFGLSLFYS